MQHTGNIKSCIYHSVERRVMDIIGFRVVHHKYVASNDVTTQIDELTPQHHASPHNVGIFCVIIFMFTFIISQEYEL
jgi:hypothetical protein